LELDLYVALHYSSGQQHFTHRNIVSFSASLFQTVSAPGVPLLPLMRGLLGVSALAGLLIFFKPLLTGIVRALVLVVRPRRTKEEQRARRHMRDAQMLQRMVNSEHGPSHAAELRAMASRG
jgi:hypothetical protein